MSAAPLSDYMNNPVFQELNFEDDHFGVKSDERVYLDLRASSGYVKEAEKLKGNDSKISTSSCSKRISDQKIKIEGVGSLLRQISVHFK